MATHPINVEATLAKMTLREKISLLVGEDGWTTYGFEHLGIPKTIMHDGPSGLGKVLNGVIVASERILAPATCIPAACSLASTWNRDLVARVGTALGEEFSAEHIDIALAPGVNIKRSPLCGRNFEYFSEDPYLAGELAASYVEGVQSAGVGATVKHFCCNNQETYRLVMSSTVDERTLREIYLPAFETVVKKARPWCLMSCYNRVNGEYVGSSRRLLTDILRTEWGYDGIVMSDWLATEDRTKAIVAGMDLEMPGPLLASQRRVEQNVRSGKLDEKEIDTCVRRMLHYVNRIITIGRPRAAQRRAVATYFDAHHAVAEDAAAEGLVLLKNENATLPMTRFTKVAVIGALAREPRIQGAGSARVEVLRVMIPLSEIERLGGSGRVSYAAGYSMEDKDVSEPLLKEAVEAARGAEKVVLFAGFPPGMSAEGADRRDLDLPSAQSRLIEAVTAVNPSTIVVVSAGSAVTMPWLGRVRAVVAAYLPGQACGTAIAKLLYGLVCPSGKLAETFPQRLEDTPAHLNYAGTKDVVYGERLYVGYRHYDGRKIAPLFPFGHGLSYTTFRYSDAGVAKARCTDAEGVDAHVTVTNTGAVAGAEVVQLYVRDVASSVDRPEKELKGFEKVLLQPGESQTVRFKLDRRAFAFYDVEARDWVVEAGDFVLLFAASSRDVRQEVTVHVTPACAPRPALFDVNTPMLYAVRLPGVDKLKSTLLQPKIESYKKNKLGELTGPLRMLVQFSGSKYDFDNLDELVEELNELSGAKRNVTA